MSNADHASGQQVSTEQDDSGVGRRAVLAGVGLLGAVAMASRSSAGPLSPPAGAVAGTPGPEPRTAVNATNTPGNAGALFRITQPGSYYLQGNIVSTGAFTGIGIEVASDGVTLDLNGFSVVGPGAGSGGAGISAIGTKDFVVRNGCVNGWRGAGISAVSAVRTTVEGVRFNANNGGGLNAGLHTRVINCHAGNSTGAGAGHGFLVGNASVVSGCTAHNNLNHGFLVGNGSTVSQCSAFQNGNHGISVGASAVVRECSSTFNTVNGFAGLGGCLFSHCVANSNLANGFTCSTNQGGVCDGCCAADNTLDGFLGPFLLRGCNAFSNGDDGFDGVHASVGCNSAANTGSAVVNGAPVPLIVDTRQA